MTDLKQTYGNKGSNSVLTHGEWNTIMEELTPAAKFIHTTEKGNFEIESKNKTVAEKVEVAEADQSKVQLGSAPEVSMQNADYNKYYTETQGYSLIIASESPNIKLETDNQISISSMSNCVWDDVNITSDNFSEYASQMGTGLKKDTDPEVKYVDGLIYGITDDDRSKKDISMSQYDSHLRYVKCRQLSQSSGINLESDTKIKLSSPKTTLEGVTGFGSTMSFGETDEGIKYQYKATKKGNIKQCDVIQVEFVNNTNSSVSFDDSSIVPTNGNIFGAEEGEQIPTFYNETATIASGQTEVIGQCSIGDIIKFVAWAKDTNFGPWDNSNLNL